jgi:hypothetical protein
MQLQRIDKRSLWTHLEPQRVLPPDSRFPFPVLQVVSGQKPSPSGGAARRFGLIRGFGHAWLRLVDQEGGVISVGFYPDEVLNIAPEKQPGLCMPGMLLHPDKYDRVASAQLVTSIRLSDQRYRELLCWLEELQQRRWSEGLPFSLTHFNCVEFVAQAAALAGVALPAHGSLVALCAELGPQPLRPLCIALSKTSPAMRLKTYNFSLRALGGRRVERRLVQPPNEKMAYVQRTARLEPLFSKDTPLDSHHWPLWHTHWLRKWQQSIGTQVLSP